MFLKAVILKIFKDSNLSKCQFKSLSFGRWGNQWGLGLQPTEEWPCTSRILNVMYLLSMANLLPCIQITSGAGSLNWLLCRLVFFHHRLHQREQKGDQRFNILATLHLNSVTTLKMHHGLTTRMTAVYLRLPYTYDRKLLLKTTPVVYNTSRFYGLWLKGF